MDPVPTLPSISEFFSNQTILVTGASGFVGKILVEKLLRCCPGVKRVYVLLRGKNGKTPEDRWDEITQQPVFSRLKEECPKTLEKVMVLQGDVAEKKLGLAVHHQIIIEEEVTVVFHSAASVRFDDPLQKAVLLNTRGALESIKLAEKMRYLKCYVYVSTAYSNCDLEISVIEEKVYPTEHDYKNMITLMESTDSRYLSIMTAKIIGNHPNTYTFSKALAEQVMSNYATKLPIVIVRPSVVINSLHEPLAGWVDNLNGLMGIIAGVNKGVLRVFLAREDCALDCVAADYAVNSLIASAWRKAVTDRGSKERQLTVYNCIYGNVRTATFSDIANVGQKVAQMAPYHNILWYPSIIITSNPALFTFLFYLLQIVPSICLDTALLLFKFQPMFLRLSKKIYMTSYALRTFTSKIYTFSNEHYQTLWHAIQEKDQKVFYMNPPDDMTVVKIMNICHIGMRQYIFNESDLTIEQAKTKFNRLYWADRVLRVFLGSIFLWILYNIICVFISRTQLLQY